MVDIPIIPLQVSTGMSVQVPFATAVNEAEGGVSGRLSTRTIPLRTYTITVNPDDAEEVLSILLACKGARWPVAIRDWAFNYQLTNHAISSSLWTDTTHVPLYRTYTPATGTRSFTQRILIIDETEQDFIVKKNGVTQTEGVNYTITDPGILTFSGALTPSPSDTITVTGQYLVPAVFVEDSLEMTVHIGGSDEVGSLVSIDNVRLREIPEDELLSLIS